MFHRCPKCDHQPLPQDQSLPASCPACGVVLAKVRQAMELKANGPRPDADQPTVSAASKDRWSWRARQAADVASNPADLLSDEVGWVALLAASLIQLPTRISKAGWWARAALWAAFAIWGLWLIARDHRNGEIMQSFIHGPLLVFHEAGHVIFSLFGHWVMVLGGTLGQLLMPFVLTIALLRQRADPFGASFGLWFLGVSLLDVAPYIYDSLHPQLMLLSGATGEEGGHDWIYLLSSMHLLSLAQGLGGLVRVLGACVLLTAVGWSGWLLGAMRREMDDE